MANGNRGVVLKEIAGGFALASDPVAEAAARRLLAAAHAAAHPGASGNARDHRLSPARLPAEIARIRGVSSESAVATLTERGLIEEAGRSRFGAVIYRTTALFEKLFGLRALDDLPDPSRFDPTRRSRPSCASGCCAQASSAPRPERLPAGPMRLAKYLAHCGVASRRVSEKIVAAGRVKVGGDLVTDPARNVDDASEVSVDGRLVSPEAHEVWAVSKPAGVTSTAREPGAAERLRRAGRLRGAAVSGRPPRRGLLGTDPAHQRRRAVPGSPTRATAFWRTCRVRLRRRASDRDLRRLREGVELDDGPTAPRGCAGGPTRD